MKTVSSLLLITIPIAVLLISCHDEEIAKPSDSHFKIVFSDGKIIDGNDIAFYDSSTCLLFLKNAFVIDPLVKSYAVITDTDTIYKGTIHSCYLSSHPKSPYFISGCSQYGENIHGLGHYGESEDLRNDSKIIDDLQKNNLLHKGLSCVIKSINTKQLTTSTEVTCTISIKNHDKVDYYILDPAKMGELKFSYYTQGIYFESEEGNPSSFIKWSTSLPDWSNLSIQDFSLLKAEHELQYTFKYSDYYPLTKGYYKARFRFSGLEYSVGNYQLNQPGGRIWVGSITSYLNHVKVD